MIFSNAARINWQVSLCSKLNRPLTDRFSEVPVSYEAQERYQTIAPCLASKLSAAEQSQALSLSDSTVARWLRQFRNQGMPGLFSNWGKMVDGRFDRMCRGNTIQK